MNCSPSMTNAAAKQSAHDTLAWELAAFLRNGGAIKPIAAGVRAKPTRKPVVAKKVVKGIATYTQSNNGSKSVAPATYYY